MRPCRRTLSLVGFALALFATMAVLLPTAAGAAGVVVQRDVQYGTDGGEPLLLDAYYSGGGSNRPALIIVHGGGWIRAGKGAFAREAESMAQGGWAAFSIEYRRDSSDRPATEAADVATAVSWVRQNAGRYGVDPSKIGLLGASSGGNVAALEAVKGTGPLDSGSRVSVVVSWSGPMDLTSLVDNPLQGCTGSNCRDRMKLPQLVPTVMGCSPSQCPSKYQNDSPVNFVSSDDPAMLLVNSTNEVIPLSQAQEMQGKLQSAGVPVQLIALPGFQHAGQYADQAWTQTVEFLTKYVGYSGHGSAGTLRPPPSSVAPLPTSRAGGGGAGGGGGRGGGGGGFFPSQPTAQSHAPLFIIGLIVVTILLATAVTLLFILINQRRNEAWRR